ncbi:MAG: threonylcarbamoyl-AMP synthase [Gammaproteobacteria bacterium]|nr:threonylcarbamoyl-AMP synthase [Gammaproteobacteria bacterium]
MKLSNDVAITALKHGAVIAYPTEAVYGLGCDPTNEPAVQSLLQIKQRDPAKGLILVAGDFKLLAKYVDLTLVSKTQWQQIQQSWPGPVTWILPKSENCPPWLSGQYNSIAVRVSAHPVIIALSESLGLPIVSTSANVSGLPPAMCAKQVNLNFKHQLGYVIDAPLGGNDQPSKIFDGITGQQIR